MPLMNSKTINSKTLKMEFKKKLPKYGISIYWDFKSLAGTEI